MVQGVSTKRRASAAAVLLALICPLLSTCDEGGYRVVVSFDPPEYAARVDRIELAFLPDCENLPAPPEALENAIVRVELSPGEAPDLPLNLDAGSYGLFARASDSCGLTLQGCSDVSLDKSARGELAVTLEVLVPGACGPGTQCRSGVCDPIDPGDADVDTDAEMEELDCAGGYECVFACELFIYCVQDCLDLVCAGSREIADALLACALEDCATECISPSSTECSDCMAEPHEERPACDTMLPECILATCD